VVPPNNLFDMRDLREAKAMLDELVVMALIAKRIPDRVEHGFRNSLNHAKMGS